MSTIRFWYDPVEDVLTIEGVKYSGELFRTFGVCHPGTAFRVEERRQDGVLVLTTLRPMVGYLNAYSTKTMGIEVAEGSA